MDSDEAVTQFVVNLPRRVGLAQHMNPGFKVAHAAKCREADGEMSLDARLRPVKHGSHLQIVLGDAEGVFDSPSSAVVRQKFRRRVLGDAGEDTGQSVPLCGFAFENLLKSMKREKIKNLDARFFIMS